MVDPYDHEIELKKGKLYDIPYKVFQISEVIEFYYLESNNYLNNNCWLINIWIIIYIIGFYKCIHTYNKISL